MKRILSIFVMAAAILVTQSCGPKKEKSKDEFQGSETPAVKAGLTVAERHAKLDKEAAERAEKRRIAFQEQASKNAYYTDSEGYIVYYKAEVDPAYSGGNEAMMKYLNENLVYPPDAKEKGIEGTVFVDFVVATDGSIREAVVTDEPGQDVDQSLRDEALRVVTSMPKWVPGRQHGKPIHAKFSLPVTFQMM